MSAMRHCRGMLWTSWDTLTPEQPAILRCCKELSACRPISINRLAAQSFSVCTRRHRGGAQGPNLDPDAAGQVGEPVELC